MVFTGTVGKLRAAGWTVFALGVINSAMPFTLIAWGQQYIDSGVAAIANATMPIWVAVFAIWLARSERATGYGWSGSRSGSSASPSSRAPSRRPIGGLSWARSR